MIILSARREDTYVCDTCNRPPFEFNYQEKPSENKNILYNVYNNSLW
jgi:hypothetical protein